LHEATRPEAISMKPLMLLTLLAGCTSSATSMNEDLGGAPPPDLAVRTTADLAAAMTGCAGIAECAVACGTDLNCQSACYLKGTAHARALTDALAACIVEVCTKADGGLGRCTMYPGDSSSDCLACAYNSAAGWPGTVACNPPSDKACDRCGTAASDCLKDL
jgi:hypothetical protein